MRTLWRQKTNLVKSTFNKLLKCINCGCYNQCCNWDDLSRPEEILVRILGGPKHNTKIFLKPVTPRAKELFRFTGQVYVRCCDQPVKLVISLYCHRFAGWQVDLAAADFPGCQIQKDSTFSININCDCGFGVLLGTAGPFYFDLGCAPCWDELFTLTFECPDPTGYEPGDIRTCCCEVFSSPFSAPDELLAEVYRHGGAVDRIILEKIADCSPSIVYLGIITNWHNTRDLELRPSCNAAREDCTGFLIAPKLDGCPTIPDSTGPSFCTCRPELYWEFGPFEWEGAPPLCSAITAGAPIIDQIIIREVPESSSSSGCP